MSLSVGDKFISNSGLEFQVERVESYRNVFVRFLTTGYRSKAATYDILRGKVRDRMHSSMYGFGYDTGGRYKTRDRNGAFSKPYLTWKNMLNRCYGTSERKKLKSYDDCVVDPIWHDFKNFAGWFELNYPSADGDWQLDKDKLSGDSKMYSPETCCFISRAENMSLIDNKVSIKLKNKTTLEVVEFGSLTEAVKYIGSDGGTMTRLKQGKCKHTKGWVLA